MTVNKIMPVKPTAKELSIIAEVVNEALNGKAPSETKYKSCFGVYQAILGVRLKGGD